MWPGLIAALALVDPAFSATYTISSPTTISAADTTYDGHDIIVTGTTLTIDGAHNFNSLQLTNSSTLTHSLSASQKLVLTSNTLTIDSTSRIDVSEKGLLPSSDVGIRAGGSYAGPATTGYATTNAPYGDLRQPNEFGMGGRGANTNLTTRGGGGIKLVVGDLTLNGAILANGETGEYSSFEGGGSGGSIWIEADTITGTGSISANGARGDTYSSGGGAGSGGRIAIYYNDISGFDLNNIEAVGGNDSDRGIYASVGTLYLKSKTSTTGDIRISHQNISRAPLPLPLADNGSDRLTVTGRARVSLSGRYSAANSGDSILI